METLPAHRYVDIERVRALQRQGLTHAEIAERLTEETGEKITRVAVSVALHRAGDTDPKPRYDDLIPWRVKMQHMRQYPVLMLRAFGRRRAGQPLTDELNRKLNLWLARLENEQVVVAYSEDEGFHYVPREGTDTGPEGYALIRKPPTSSSSN